jgi:uncharacterized membrane protein YjdF
LVFSREFDLVITETGRLIVRLEFGELSQPQSRETIKMETKPIVNVLLALIATALGYFLTKLWFARSFFLSLRKQGMVSDLLC